MQAVQNAYSIVDVLQGLFYVTQTHGKVLYYKAVSQNSFFFDRCKFIIFTLVFSGTERQIGNAVMAVDRIWCDECGTKVPAGGKLYPYVQK
jgi:hypothetical protein